MRRQPDDKAFVLLPQDTKRALTKTAHSYGYTRLSDFLKFLATAFEDERVLVLDRLTKELLVGAAEEIVLSKARKAAREEALYTLYEEGYRATPYPT